VRPIIAIDPGAEGGIAWRATNGAVYAEPMPEGMTAQADMIRSLAAESPGAQAVIEKVGSYMPGNSGPGAVTFARHCGHLEAICYMCGMPTQQVLPQTWMKYLGSLPKGKTAKEKGARKRAIKEAMARAYPCIAVTLKTSDALGILTWAKGEEKR